MHGDEIFLDSTNIESFTKISQFFRYQKLEKKCFKWLKENITADNFVKLYQLGQSIKSKLILKKVEVWFSINLNGENALSFHQMVFDSKIKSLQKIILLWIKNHPDSIINGDSWKNLDYPTMKKWLTKLKINTKKAEQVWLSHNPQQLDYKPELVSDLFTPEFVKGLSPEEIITWLAKPIIKSDTTLSDLLVNKLKELFKKLSKDEITTWLTKPVINSNPILLNTLVQRLTEITKAKETEHFDDFYIYTGVSLPENVVDLKITKCLHSEWEDAPEYHHDYSYDVEFTYWCLEAGKKIPITVSIYYRSWATYENRFEPYIEKDIKIKVDSARVSNLTARWCEMYFNDPTNGEEYEYDNLPEDDHPMKLIDNLYNQYVDEFSYLASKIYDGFGEIKA